MSHTMVVLLVGCWIGSFGGLFVRGLTKVSRAALQYEEAMSLPKDFLQTL